MRAGKIVGCTLIGCLGLPVALALMLGGVVVFDRMAAKPADPHFQELEQAVPGSSAPYRGSETDGEARTVEALPGGVELPATASPGVLHLDVSAAELRIEPIPAGEPIRIEADYDRGAFELEHAMHEGGDGWEYRVRFAPRSWLGSFSREEVDNRLRIGIPAGVPFRIEGRVRLAESDIELGGLSVTAVDLEAGIGDHTIGFLEPTPEPLESFVIDGSIGSLDLFDLGNGSPHEIRITQSVGELSLDLGGDWRNDSLVRLDVGVGELRVDRPTTARVESRGARLVIGEATLPRDRIQEEDESLPLIVLETEGTIGEVRVD